VVNGLGRKRLNIPLKIVSDCLQAHRNVVTAANLEPEQLDAIKALEVEDFYSERNGYLFQSFVNLKGRGISVDQITVASELHGMGKLEAIGGAAFLSHLIASCPTPLDCPYYAQVIREWSLRRQLVMLSDKITETASDKKQTIGDIVDKAKAALDSFSFPHKLSRYVTFSNPRKYTSDPPQYFLYVASNNGTGADIKFSSPELDQPMVVKRKIRERLNINPILPKDFDALIHLMVKQAMMDEAPQDASVEESIFFWIREWFKTAIEAEEVEDLAQGFIDKEGSIWFQSDRLVRYLQEKAKVKLTRPALGSILATRGLTKSKLMRLGTKAARVWGLPKAFFQVEDEVADGDNLPLEETPEKPGAEMAEGAPGEAEENMSWLENEERSNGV
jgi:hypothetical protein